MAMVSHERKPGGGHPRCDGFWLKIWMFLAKRGNDLGGLLRFNRAGTIDQDSPWSQEVADVIEYLPLYDTGLFNCRELFQYLSFRMSP
jgi:hypothetical protein